MSSRRDFMRFAGIAGGAVTASSVSRVSMAALPEPVFMDSSDTAAPLYPETGRDYNPVVTPNGWTAPWRMRNGIKEFHLVAEPVVRDMAPGFKANLRGYNGQSPRPTIEVVEGDRVRIYVTNKLPEHTVTGTDGGPTNKGFRTPEVTTDIAVGQMRQMELKADEPGDWAFHCHKSHHTMNARGTMCRR